MSNAACDIAEVLGAPRSSSPPTAGARLQRSHAIGRSGRSSPATHKRYALQQMAIEWGVAMEIEECANVEHLWATLDASRSTGHRLPGDQVVITAGAVNVPGTTTVLGLETA